MQPDIGFLSLVFFSLCFFSFVLVLISVKPIFYFFRKKRRKNLQLAYFRIFIAILIVIVNMTMVFPEYLFHHRYDSVRYNAHIGLDPEFEGILPENFTWHIILPVPLEDKLITDIHFVDGEGTIKLVETDFGKGLEIYTTDASIDMDGEYVTTQKEVESRPSMMAENKKLWPIFIGCNNEQINVTFCLFELRMIHQNKNDLSAFQTFFQTELSFGWQWVRVQHYID